MRVRSGDQQQEVLGKAVAGAGLGGPIRAGHTWATCCLQLLLLPVGRPPTKASLDKLFQMIICTVLYTNN